MFGPYRILHRFELIKPKIFPTYIFIKHDIDINTMQNPSPELIVMRQAVERGGEIVADLFDAILQITEKTSAADLRTQADIQSENIILEILKKDFPAYNILAEESGHYDNNSEYTFIIDPLDGTHNFVLGIPIFTISLALKKGNQIIAGVVHNPILKHTYYAETGKGAYRNEFPLKISTTSSLSRATISCNRGYHQGAELIDAVKIKLTPKTTRILTNWSPAHDYCLLAAGKTECMISNKTEIHDFAAGKLIAREAGARITDLAGNEETDMTNDQFIMSNNTGIHDEVVTLIKNLHF